MKYKVGDKVRIKSLDWYNENRTKHGDIWFDNAVFVGGQSLYCGCELTIRLVTNDSYYVIENDYYWIDEMIEGLVEEPIILNGKEIMLKLADIELPSGTINIWELPDGYQFLDENGNVINATKIIKVKKKKEYPKTFRECQDYLEEDVPPRNEPISKTNRRILVHLLEILLVCRDAYWKLYGEEMGLGKPWKPDWHDDEKKYTIEYYDGEIIKDFSLLENRILVFPTIEMRDAFYENFKELINECKELL